MVKPVANGYSVLLIDDDPAIRDIYATTLTDAGYIVYTATDGGEGLQLAKTKHPSLILLDLMMPKMDGREMLKRLKADETLKTIPTIVFSALITELEKQDSLAAGATAYVEKSDIDEPDELLTHVSNALGAPTNQANPI